MAEHELESQMVRKLRAEAKDTSAAAAKDRRQLSKTRVITQVEVARLRGE